MVRSSSSRGPSSVTIGIDVGMVMMCVGTCGLAVVTSSRSSRSLGAEGWSASVMFRPVYVCACHLPTRRLPSFEPLWHRKPGTESGSKARSAGRPGHPAAAEHVQVGVEDGLSGLLAGVGDHPEPLVEVLLRHGGAE